MRGAKSQDSVRKPQPFWREGRAEKELSRGPSAYQPNTLPLGQTSSQYLELIGESYLYDTCSYTSWIPHSISLSVTSAQSQGGDKVLPLPYLALFSEPAPVPTPVPSSITQV